MGNVKCDYLEIYGKRDVDRDTVSNTLIYIYIYI